MNLAKANVYLSINNNPEAMIIKTNYFVLKVPDFSREREGGNGFQPKQLHR